MAQQPVSGLQLMEDGLGAGVLARYNPDVTLGLGGVEPRIVSAPGHLQSLDSGGQRNGGMG